MVLAYHLDLNDSDILLIKQDYPNNLSDQALAMMHLWYESAGEKATGKIKSVLDGNFKSRARDSGHLLVGLFVSLLVHPLVCPLVRPLVHPSLSQTVVFPGFPPLPSQPCIF